MLFVGKLPRQPVAFFVYCPDHVRCYAHLHAGARRVVAAHLLPRVSNGMFGLFYELARKAIFLAEGDEAAAYKTAHPSLFESFYNRLDHAGTRMDVHEVNKRCHSRSDGFDASVKGRDVRVFGSEMNAARACHAREPLLEDHVVAEALQQRLKQMRVRVDHARHHDPSLAID